MINPLKPGMIFESPREAAKFINFTTSTKCDSIYRALRHYCSFHKDKKLRIYIDDVLEEPIPFPIKEFVYKIGQRFSNKYGSFYIKDMYIKRPKGQKKGYRVYLCVCDKDGTEFERLRSEIANGVGCPECGRKRVIDGCSLYDEHPEILQYLVNPEDAKNYTSSSSKKILCRCPICGSLKWSNINILAHYGFVCLACGDGISYPNKFIQAMLDQLNVNHEPEKVFSWSDNKVYDQYLEYYSLIIENHGKQHYVDNVNAAFPHNSYANVIDNDAYKRQLAADNGIKQYVVLDCSVSDSKWIRDQVMSSELPIIIGFSESDINWELCDYLATKSKVKQAWELWNNGFSTEYISDQLGISLSSARSYIHRGVDLGQCVGFSVQENQSVYQPGSLKTTRNAQYTNGQLQPIHCVTDNTYFASRYDCEMYYPDLFPSTVGSYNLMNCIRNRNGKYKGKIFEKISKSQFNDMKKQSEYDSSIIAIGKPFKIKRI